MNIDELKGIFFSRAEVEDSEKITCDSCFEHIVFMLRDSQDREFSVGLGTILDCLAFAIDNGDLPKLPVSWLSDVDNVYRTGFSENKNISYYDEETYKKRYQS